MSFDPWSSEIDKFLALVLASRLIGFKTLKDACREFGHNVGTGWNNQDLSELCEYLVRNNRLTLWQCKMLIKGLYKGFFLGEYKLLDHIGNDEADKLYLAEDRTTKSRVRLRVTPPIIIPGEKSKPYYEVQEQ